ncbi:MAG: Gfo/Idh/MocA family oxidoreductase [Planctomycetes bacterium]|nr:Gfo/Idh/MocA family oxidoreductase [Planctomycetota bacterium]
MVGGGPGAFIGGVHRICLAMDGQFQLVAGAFSSDPAKSRQTGGELGLDPKRVYATWGELLDVEARLPADQRIHAVSIVTPNHVHFGPAKAALERGFHVICDKPLCITVEEADELERLVAKTGLRFCVTHNYTGYPMVREARNLVRSGRLGDVRKVYVEYLQGWLSDKLEDSGQKQAKWRSDPKQSGACGAMGDIGTHAANLAEHIAGSPLDSLYARLTTFVPGRLLDDDGMVLFKLKNGANGTLSASQVCVGRENGLMIRVFGTKGGLQWEQEKPNDLQVWWKDKAPELWRPGNGWVDAEAKTLQRIPPGHPEGYLEAFANLYKSFALAIRGQPDISAPFPTVSDGLAGMKFLRACVKSSKEDRWVGV